MRPGLQQEEELPTLCRCGGVCRAGGGKMRNFPLVPSVFSEKRGMRSSAKSGLEGVGVRLEGKRKVIF